jgi:RNA polymerase sigma factor for flagellar operon FliA
MPGESDDFVREYAVFVRGIAKQTKLQLALDCESEDLVAFGFEGLLQAKERFDAARNVPFKSFAYYRVRGAILDGVRSMAYLPRRAHARMKAAIAVDLETESLGEANAAAASGASGSAAAGPQAIENKLRAIDGVLGRIAAAYTTAQCADDVAAAAGLEGQRTPEDLVLATERRTLTKQALALLPEQERFLLEGHYIHGRPFDELARELGLSKSWASRLHTRALDRLRQALVAVA